MVVENWRGLKLLFEYISYGELGVDWPGKNLWKVFLWVCSFSVSALEEHFIKHINTWCVCTAISSNNLSFLSRLKHFVFPRVNILVSERRHRWMAASSTPVTLSQPSGRSIGGGTVFISQEVWDIVEKGWVESKDETVEKENRKHNAKALCLIQQAVDGPNFGSYFRGKDGPWSLGDLEEALPGYNQSPVGENTSSSSGL